MESLKLKVGSSVVPQQGIENGAFYVRVCVASASASGLRQASAQPTTTGVRASYLILFSTRNAQGILQNT